MRSIEDPDVKGKTVFLRVDFNVPLNEDGTIRNDKRIKASLPSITYLLGKGAKLVMASHLGRPKGKPDPKMSLRPVAARLAELIGRDVEMAPDVVGPEVDRMKAALQEGQALLLENVRFHPGETKNDPELAKALAAGVDVFVNDAFGSSHRSHASVVGIVDDVPVAAAGYLMKKEVDNLRKAIVNPARPYVAILGGAKTEDKIPVIDTLLNKADAILIGGAMAYTFFLAQGLDVGASLVEPDKVDVARSVMKRAAEKRVRFELPVDSLLTASLESGKVDKTQEGFPFPAGFKGVDIGPKTIAVFSRIIAGAKTIFWNGPLGVFETPAFAQGTIKIAEAVASSGAFSIVGGGDSIAAVDKAGVSAKITHISTGGGASLEFIANETLPGIEALEKKA